MAAFCLPKKEASVFLEALKAGTIDIDKLMDMSSAERRTFFDGIVGKDNAEGVNALFESKMLLKDQKRGMINWAKKVAGISETSRRDMMSKIEKLEHVLSHDHEDSFLADLAAQKLGVTVTSEEAKHITDLSKIASDEKAKGSDNFSGVSDEYLKASDDLMNYINSLKPVSALRSIGKNAAIIARNNLLMNPSTPIKTTVGQAVNSAMDIVTRRIAQQSFGGANSELAAAANKQAWQTFRETGFNTASMESLTDAGKLGEKGRFDVPDGLLSTNPVLHAAESAVRNVAKVSNKIAIDWEHNIAFTKFYQSAFFDMLNIASTNIAKSESLVGDALKSRAAEVFRDATKIEPETDIGALIRMEGQKQAARVTSTNETLVARLALGVKDSLNKAVTGLGDALMPIAKIPANIIWNGIENAGLGVPIGAKEIFEGRAKIQSNITAIRYEGMAQFSSGVQRIARTVGTIAAAAYFTSLLTKDDFKSDRYGNHFVKIGNVWINTEYISAISPALAGMMDVKKKGAEGQSFFDGAGQYVSGAAQGLKSAPGINELSSLVGSIADSDKITGIKKYAENFFDSRGVPAFISNLFKDRPIDRLFFGAHGVETEDQAKQDNADTKTQTITSRLDMDKFGLDVWGQPTNLLGQDQHDPVDMEVKRIGYEPSFPSVTIGGVKLSDTQYRDYIVTSGRLAKLHIGALIGIPGWQSFPAAWRKNEIGDVIRHDRAAAFAKVQMESMGTDHDLVQLGIAAKTAESAPPTPASP